MPRILLCSPMLEETQISRGEALALPAKLPSSENDGNNDRGVWIIMTGRAVSPPHLLHTMA